MFLIEHFNVPLRLFKFIGIAPIARNEKRTKLKRFLYNIPIFVSSAFMLCVAAYLLLFPHFTPYSSVYTIISYSSTVSFIFIIFTANVQCYYYNSVYQSMNYRIREIEKRCRDEFWTKCPKNIQFRYKLKILLIFFLFFLSQGLVFVEVLLNGSRLWSSFLTSFLRLIYPIAVLHVIIYSDIVAMFILEVNAQIRNSSTFVHSSNKIEVLKNIKLMHMDVWMLVVQINKFFGWNLLLLVINSFIYIIRQLYWIFLALQLQWQSLAVIGRFNIIHIQDMQYMESVTQNKKCSPILFSDLA